jgi:hypothetical protein
LNTQLTAWIARNNCGDPGGITRNMSMRSPFVKWIMLFAGTGLLIPALILLYWTFSKTGAGREMVLWPSSLMFMGLDGPNPRLIIDIVIVYAIAWIENVVLYAIIGVLTWPLTYYILRLKSRKTAR